MTKFCNWLRKNSEWGPFLIRLVMGIGFIAHGYQKFTGMEGVIGFFGSLGFPAFLAYVVMIVELFGGVLLVLGLFTRQASALIAIIMLVAMFYVKIIKNSAGLIGGFELDMVYLGTAIGMMFTGPGMLSLEKKLFKKEL